MSLPNPPTNDPTTSSCGYQPILRGEPHLCTYHSSRAYQQAGSTAEGTLQGEKGSQSLSGGVRGWLCLAYDPHESRQASQTHGHGPSSAYTHPWASPTSSRIPSEEPPKASPSSASSSSSISRTYRGAPSLPPASVPTPSAALPSASQQLARGAFSANRKSAPCSSAETKTRPPASAPTNENSGSSFRPRRSARLNP